MKRPNRDYSIFNISMLDTISGAFGAVMIIMILLLTQKMGEESMSCEDVRTELITSAQKLSQTNRELTDAKAELKKMAAARDSRFTKIVETTANTFKQAITKIADIKTDMLSSPEKDKLGFNIPRKIVMLIDLSGSMSAENNKYKEDRLSQIKAALKMFIAGMDQEYYIDIVYFPAFPENIDSKEFPDFKIEPALDARCKNFEMRDEAYDNSKLSCYKYGYFEGGLKQLLAEKDKLNFYKKIACLKAYHDTPTQAAFDFVLNDERYKSAEGIILFSDGQPDTIRKKIMTQDELLRYIKKRNKQNKKIFTVGVGTEFRNNEDSMAVDFSKKLALQNQGFYIGF